MVRAVWLADVLKDAGLKVLEEPGWRVRGREMGTVQGVLCHHTAGPKNGNMPSLSTVRDGRPGLKGPLSHLLLARDGTFVIVAAGRCNHAGDGRWPGVTGGNSNLIGIEAENTGYTKGKMADPWPAVQIDAYAKGIAAILVYLKLPVNRAIGHKEWAPHRKIDPTFDMNNFRERIKTDMARKKKTMLEEVKAGFESWIHPDEKQPPVVEGPTESTSPVMGTEVQAGFEPWIEEGISYEEWVKKQPGLPSHETAPTILPAPGTPADVITTPPGTFEEVSRPWRETATAKTAIKKGPDGAVELLKSFGWPKIQAAALIAQAVVDTKMDPNYATYVVNKKPTTRENPLAEVERFGIMNWDKARTANLDTFVNWWNTENKTSLKKNDEEAQVRFVDWELKNTEKPAFDKLKASTELTEAVRATTGYVRPTNWSEESPESSVKWADRVVAAFALMNN